MSRTCARTGLTLLSDNVSGYRVAKLSYGPVDPPEQPATVASRADWSRFDTPGSTIYLADRRRTAFAETTAWARMTPSHKTHLEKSAALFGIPIDEMNEMIRADWEKNGHMAPGWLPSGWRESRLIYELRIDQQGDWIDLTNDGSISVINRELGVELNETCSVAFVTLSTLTGENREATTLIATWLREQVLQDGNYPLGIKFHSKHGAGACWAFWLRRRDERLGSDRISELSATEIEDNDPDYCEAIKAFGIGTR